MASAWHTAREFHGVGHGIYEQRQRAQGQHGPRQSVEPVDEGIEPAGCAHAGIPPDGWHVRRHRRPRPVSSARVALGVKTLRPPLVTLSPKARAPPPNKARPKARDHAHAPVAGAVLRFCQVVAWADEFLLHG